MRLNVEWWYRLPGEPDQLRAIPQMQSAAESEQAVEEYARRLETSGYIVQRVQIAEACPVCGSAGRIAFPPKGTRKAKIASLPAWRMVYRQCSACQGRGETNARELVRAGVEVSE